MKGPRGCVCPVCPSLLADGSWAASGGPHRGPPSTSRPHFKDQASWEEEEAEAEAQRSEADVAPRQLWVGTKGGGHSPGCPVAPTVRGGTGAGIGATSPSLGGMGARPQTGAGTGICFALVCGTSSEGLGHLL